MKYQIFVLCIMLLAMLIVPVSGQTATEIPEKIDFSMRYTGGNGRLIGSRQGSINVNGWYYLTSGQGGYFPNMIQIGQLDVQSLFEDIDFSEAENWQIEANDSIEIYDDDSYELQVTLKFEGKDILVTYTGQNQGDDLLCNIQAACEFIVTLFTISYYMSTRDTVQIPHPISFMGLVFLFFSILLPYRNKERVKGIERSKWIPVIEGIALYLDYFLIYLIVMYIIEITSIVSLFVPFGIAIVVEYFIYRWYIRLFWDNPEKMNEINN